jgi:2-polyprenyl-6-methoxyphenol hydroxylase-like FAD-dependent oxidoreductase
MYQINQAAVIGAGTMGLGIAGQLANADIDVLLLDVPSDGQNRNAVAERALERLLDPNQPGLLHKDKLHRISIGNIEDDMHQLDFAFGRGHARIILPRVRDHALFQSRAFYAPAGTGARRGHPAGGHRLS